MRFSGRILKCIPVLLSVLIVASSTPTLAQKAKKPTRAEKRQAREAYSRGQNLFDAGQFEEAQSAFEEAYEAVPNPIVLLSIAESQRKLGQVADAVATLERYLEEKPDAPDRTSVEEKIEELKSYPATLVISSDPEGAAIKIDGEDTGQITPAEISLTPGEHVVVLTAPDGQHVSELIEVEFGTRHELVMELGEVGFQDPFAEEDAKAEQISTSDPIDDTKGRSLVLPIVLTSVGGAAIITGTVLGVVTLSKKSDYEDNPTEKRADDVEKFGLITDVVLGVGLVAAVTGVVLFFTMNDKPAQQDVALTSDRRMDLSRIELIPIASEKEVQMSARFWF